MTNTPKIVMISVAVLIIAFLTYLIFIKKEEGKIPKALIDSGEATRELTDDEKIAILEKLMSQPPEEGEEQEQLTIREKKEILKALSAPPAEELIIQEE